MSQTSDKSSLEDNLMILQFAQNFAAAARIVLIWIARRRFAHTLAHSVQHLCCAALLIPLSTGPFIYRTAHIRVILALYSFYDMKIIYS